MGKIRFTSGLVHSGTANLQAVWCTLSLPMYKWFDALCHCQSTNGLVLFGTANLQMVGWYTLELPIYKRFGARWHRQSTNGLVHFGTANLQAVWCTLAPPFYK